MSLGTTFETMAARREDAAHASWFIPAPRNDGGRPRDFLRPDQPEAAKTDRGFGKPENELIQEQLAAANSGHGTGGVDATNPNLLQALANQGYLPGQREEKKRERDRNSQIAYALDEQRRALDDMLADIERQIAVLQDALKENEAETQLFESRQELLALMREGKFDRDNPEHQRLIEAAGFDPNRSDAEIRDDLEKSEQRDRERLEELRREREELERKIDALEAERDALEKMKKEGRTPTPEELREVRDRLAAKGVALTEKDAADLLQGETTILTQRNLAVQMDNVDTKIAQLVTQLGENAGPHPGRPMQRHAKEPDEEVEKFMKLLAEMDKTGVPPDQKTKIIQETASRLSDEAKELLSKSEETADLFKPGQGQTPSRPGPATATQQQAEPVEKDVATESSAAPFPKV